MKKLLLLAALMFSFGLSAQRLEVGATTAAAMEPSTTSAQCWPGERVSKVYEESDWTVHQ
jgi:hypothetical protein